MDSVLPFESDFFAALFVDVDVMDYSISHMAPALLLKDLTFSQRLNCISNLSYLYYISVLQIFLSPH
jgi:hypothetical protein